MEIKYQKTGADLGLTAFFEGQRLVFSGNIKQDSTSQTIIKKFFRLEKSKEKEVEKNFITTVDLHRLFSKNAKEAWSNALTQAHKQKKQLGVEDVFLALLKKSSVRDLFIRMKVNTKSTEIFLKNYCKLKPTPSYEIVQSLPFGAFELTVKLKNHKIGSLMLLGALLKNTPKDNVLQAIFSGIGLTLEKLELISVWLLNLNYQFPKNSYKTKLLYCCQQASVLENHFGYFFELPAIETALALSTGKTLINLEHKKALQLLVKAAGLAKIKKTKTITEKLVRQASKI